MNTTTKAQRINKRQDAIWEKAREQRDKRQRDYFNLDTPEREDYSHHEYKDIDVRNLTRGQLIESYCDAKAHAQRLAEALKKAQAYFVACSRREYTYQRKTIADEASEALAAWEGTQQ